MVARVPELVVRVTARQTLATMSIAAWLPVRVSPREPGPLARVDDHPAEVPVRTSAASQAAVTELSRPRNRRVPPRSRGRRGSPRPRCSDWRRRSCRRREPWRSGSRLERGGVAAEPAGTAAGELPRPAAPAARRTTWTPPPGAAGGPPPRRAAPGGREPAGPPDRGPPPKPRPPMVATLAGPPIGNVPLVACPSVSAAHVAAPRAAPRARPRSPRRAPGQAAPRAAPRTRPRPRSPAAWPRPADRRAPEHDQFGDRAGADRQRGDDPGGADAARSICPTPAPISAAVNGARNET